MEFTGIVSKEPASPHLNIVSFKPCSICRCCAKKIQAIWEAFKIIWIIIKQRFSCSPYEIRALDLNRISPEMQQKLKDFERSFDYPLGGGKRFRIIHGKGGDYFGFVRRIGSPKFYVAINKKERRITKQVTVDGRQVNKEVVLKAGEIAGVGCGILSEINQGGGKTLKAWYICDLKVKEEYRGDHIPIRIFQKGFWRFFQCSRGYAICMNPADGSVPKAAHIWQQHGALSSKTLPLNLYNLSAKDIRASRKRLEEACKGPIYFKSMKGIKEFEIFQERNPEKAEEWRMLHIQHGPKGEKEVSPSVSVDPKSGHDHLIAAVAGSALDRVLASIKNIKKFSSATVVYRGLDPSVLENNILTNEI
ncbi:MAG: hypothetical protein K1000chlam3_00607 [Chlamydiae bacterium]|nr:hypothetical protein [Chlamydiota bacterium]